MATTESVPSPRDILAAIQRSSLKGPNGDEISALMAQDGVLEWPYAPAGIPNRLQGRQQIREFLNTLAAQGSPLTVHRVDNLEVHDGADPEVVIAEYDVHARSSITNEEIVQRVVLVLRVRDGEIVSMRDYINPLVLLAAMGKSLPS